MSDLLLDINLQHLPDAYFDLEAKVMFRTLELEREVLTLRQQPGK